MGKTDKYLKRGLAFLEGDKAAVDYEQAFYWISEACNNGSSEAESILLDMREKSLGVPFEGDVPDTDEFFDCEEGKTIEGAIQNLPPNPDRCIACGVEALVPSDFFTGAKYCSPNKGGCGTNLMIPIAEDGLNRGIALQPYSEKLPGGEGIAHSSLGTLINIVKYDKRVDDDLRTSIIKEIVKRIIECEAIEQLVGGYANHDLLVIPAPSSVYRKVQPVDLLARLISENRFEYDNPLTKRSRVESKNRQRGMELDPNDISCRNSVDGRTILLVDDTYGEGATLRACIRALRSMGARDIFFMSLGKNTFGGMKGQVD